MKIYLAGKITGNLEYKKQFAEKADQLRKAGHAVVNPAVLEDGLEHREYLHICSAMIDVCEAVYFMKNWQDSKGAHFEMGYATKAGKEIAYL